MSVAGRPCRMRLNKAITGAGKRKNICIVQGV